MAANRICKIRVDIVDKMQQWDVIRALRIWDGQTMTSR